MLASLTAQPDPDRNRVRLELSRSDDATVVALYLDRAQAHHVAQQLIRSAAELRPEPEDPR